MLKLMQLGIEKFADFKCGDVYCITPVDYQINCSLCGRKLPFAEFPQHFRADHLHPDNSSQVQKTTTTTPNKNVEKAPEQIEITPFDIFDVKSEVEAVEALDEPEIETIEFHEVKLPKLDKRIKKAFIAENEASDAEDALDNTWPEDDCSGIEADELEIDSESDQEEISAQKKKPAKASVNTKRKPVKDSRPQRKSKKSKIELSASETNESNEQDDEINALQSFDASTDNHELSNLIDDLVSENASNSVNNKSYETVKTIEEKVALVAREIGASKEILSTIVSPKILMLIKCHYEEDGALGASHQNMLTKEIVKYYIENGIEMNKHIYKAITKQIIAMFPRESPNIYYKPSIKLNNTCHRARGKLVSRYYNMRKHMKPKVDDDTYLDHTDIVNLDHTDIIKPEVPEEEEEVIKKEVTEDDDTYLKSWLKYNFSPVDDVLKRWKASSSYRLREIQKPVNLVNILSEWPAYAQSIGPQLIAIDFDRMYPSACAGVKFWINYDKLLSLLPNILKMHLKDSLNKQIWQRYMRREKTLSKDCREIVLMHLVHACLKPNVEVLNSGEATLMRAKPTIADSQYAVVKFYITPLELKEFKDSEPCIAVHTAGLFHEIHAIFVVCKNIKFECTSFAQALFCLFQIYHVFRFRYPKHAHKFYMLLQRKLFGICLENDKFTSDVESIIHFLNNY